MTFTRQQPALKPWCTYLHGYLVFEAHHDWAEAERIFTQLLQSQLETDLHGRVLYALGRTLDAQGRWIEAIAAFEQALAIAIEFDRAIEQARTWKHLAITYHGGFTRGDFEPIVLQQALIYCQEALTALEPFPDPPPDVAYLQGSIWNTLGGIYMNLGQWEQAITSYQQDLTICRTQDDRFGIGLTLHNLGEVYQKRGDWSEALTAYKQALTIIREFDDRYEETDVLANLAFLHQEMAESEQAIDYYSQAIEVIEDLRSGVSSEAAQAGFFATVVDTYANAVLLYLTTGREMQAFDYVERARSRAFLDTLAAARSPGLSEEMKTRTITLTEVQAALPTDALLLEYFTTGLVEAQGDQAPKQPAERHRFPLARTLLFAVTRNELQVYDSGLSPNDLHPKQLDSVVERHFLKAPIRRALYDRLIGPIEALLQGKRRLYLIPHGPLHYIPFQALIAPDGDTLLREGGPQFIYAPSATLLFRYGPTKLDRAPKPCLAVGYNNEGDIQLYLAEDEARSLARLTGGQALVGLSPKKATLYGQAADYRLLHLACHGEFDSKSPLDSFLQLAPNERLTVLDILEGLRLQCDLVTLSACESGLNRVRRGDELIGLMRAFIYAGTPALVSTLWRVYEKPTRILMERFYQHLQQGLEFAEALKRAQLYVKNLSYQEALHILATFAAEGTNEPTASTSMIPEPHPNPSPPAMTLSQATAFFRGGTGPGQSDVAQPLSTEPALHHKVFADPYYWAAFILIGDHGS